MLRELRSTITVLGCGNTLLYGMNRLFRMLGVPWRIEHYKLVVQPVLKEPTCPPALGRTICIRRILERDAFLSLRKRVPKVVLESRWRQPTQCFGAFRNERLLAYLWLCNGPYEEDEVRCQFRPLPEKEAVWDFDVYVFPEHRLGPAFARIWDEVYAILRRRGVRFTFSRISATNPKSMNVHRRLKATVVGTALFFSLRPVQLMFASVPPYVNVSIRPSTRPIITLRAPEDSVDR